MMRPLLVLLVTTTLLSAVVAFSPSPPSFKTPFSTLLKMANDEDLLRWARSSRSAGINDRVVELKRPLGLVLQEDEDGNVFVETVAPRGNAGRTGMVRFLLFPPQCVCAYWLYIYPLCASLYYVLVALVGAVPAFPKKARFFHSCFYTHSHDYYPEWPCSLIMPFSLLHYVSFVLLTNSLFSYFSLLLLLLFC